MPQAVVSILTAVSKAVTFGKIAGGTAALIIGATTIVGASFAASRLLRPKMDMDIGDGDGSRQKTVRSTIEPQKLVYGETMVSGPLTYAQCSGDNNRYLHQVIALAGHELTEIKEVYFDDKSIDLTDSNIYNSSTKHVIGGFFGPEENENGVSETIVYIDTRLGAATQTAYAGLRSDTTTQTEYLATHRGDGIASLYTKWTLHEGSREVWDEVGAVQSIKAVVKGKKVYDPRLDVNAGNTAGANPTNASYIVYSDNSLSTGSAVGNYDRSNQGQNPALILADYLMDSRFGLGIASSKIDWASVVAAADHCDQLVPIPTSATQKRFFGSGVIFGGDKHRRSIEKILSAMNGSLVYTSGKYVIRAGVYFAASETLTENDVIGPVQVQTAIPRSDRFNQVKGLFIDPNENYKMMEFGPVTTGANDFNSQPVGAIARDNGEVLTEEVKLPFTSNRYAAQRLALLQVAQSYHQTVVTVPVNLKGMRIAIGDRVNLTIDALNEVDSGSWSPKIFKCIGWSFSESDSGGIDLTLIEDFSASYNNPQESDYSTITAAGVITTGLPDVPSPTNFTATAGINRVELNWTNPPNSGAWEQIWVYASTSSTTPTDSSTPIAKFRGTSFTHMLDGGTNNYYWIQAVRYPNGTTPGSGQTNAAKSAFIPSNPTNVTANKITTAVIGDQQVDTTQIANDAIGSAQMDTIQSSNYSASAGSEAGWKIDQDGSAEFNNVVVRGNVNATTGTIGGLTVGSDKLYVGTGTFNNSNTAFYVDDQGQLSLKDKLTWNGSALSVTGTINATGGTFSGTVQVDDYITVGGSSSTSTIAGISGVTSSDLRMWAGDTFANSETAPFRVESDGTVITSRLIVTQPNDTTSVIFDSAQDGLVGVGLSNLSQDTGIVVQEPSAVLSSQTATQAVTLSSTQTLTLTVTMELPYPKVSTGQILAAAYPSDITATIQYSTDNGSNWSTFGSAVVKQRALSNASSDNTKFGVRTFAIDGIGGGYVRDLHAIDAAGNLILSASASLGADDYLFRVQLASTNGTDSRFNPDLTANRTLKFETDAAGFTVSANGTIVDAPGNTATIGYVSSNFAALESTNTFKMGSGEFNLFEDDSGNDVLNIQENKTSAYQLLEVVHADNIPGSNQADIIFKVRNNSSDFFTIAKAGVVTWSGGGSANANTAYTYSQVGHLPLAGGTVSGNLVVTGDFTVQGTTTTLDTATLNVEDKNITLNYSTGDSSGSADGAGITIQDAVNSSTDATLNWNATNDRWEFSHQMKTPSLMVGAKERIDVDGDLNNIRNLNISGNISTATFADGSEARFGDDNDMALFHSASVNHLRVNSGTFKLRADDMRFTAQDGTTEFMKLASTGATFLSPTGSGQAADLNFLSTNTSGFGNGYAIDSRIRSVTAGSSNAYHSKLEFYTNDTSNNLDLALTLDSAQNATFAGNLDVGGSITKTGDLTLDSSGHISLDADDSGHVRFKDGGTQYASIYKSGSDAVIDNTGTLTLDVEGILILDADNTGIVDFKDGGTHFGRIENASSDFKLESRVQDKDIVLVGNDGGVGVEALRLDMSAAGKAVFNAGATFSSTTTHYGNGAASLTWGDTSDVGALSFSGSNAIVRSTVNNADLILQGNSGGFFEALRLDMSASGHATFNSGLKTNGTIENDSSGHAYLYLDNGGSHESGIVFQKNNTNKWEAPYISSSSDTLKFYSYTGPGLQMQIRPGVNDNGGTILSGLHVSDGTGFYGSYGALLLDTDAEFTGSSRGWMVTNAYEANKFALLYSSSATSLPSLSTNGAVASGTSVGMSIDNAGTAYFSGKVGIGTDSPSSYYSKNLVVMADGDGTGGITIAAPATDDTTYLAFADGTSGASTYAGYLGYAHANNSFFVGTNAVTRFTILSDGKTAVGGNHTPGSELHVKGSDETQVWIEAPSGYNPGIRLLENGTSKWTIANDQTNDGLFFYDFGASAERLRITADGVIAVGPFGGNGNAVIAGTSSPSFTNQPGTNLVLKSGDGSGTGSSYMQFFTSPAGSSGTTVNTAQERMRIGNTGNIGISSFNLTHDLGTLVDANNATIIGNGTSGSYFGYNVAYNNGAWKYQQSSAVGLLSFTNSGVLTFRNASSGTAGNTASLTERFLIDSLGRVGVQNSSPANYTGSGSNTFVLGNSSVSNGSHGMTIVAGSQATSSIAFSDHGGNGGTTDYRGLFQYVHADDSLRIFTASTERLRVNNSGHLRLYGGEVRFVSTSYEDRSLGIDSLGFYLYNNADGRYDFQVDPNGNVGIGVNPASYHSAANQLVVYNDTSPAGITIVGGTTNTSNVFFADGTSGNQLYRGYVQYQHGSDRFAFGAAGDDRMFLDGSGNGTFSGNVTAYSDERLKSGIETLDGSKVLEMRGVSYTRDGVAGSGVIAQELEKHAPELVHTADDEIGTKSVAYANLTGYLIEAVKMQAKQIAELQQALEDLKNGDNKDKHD